MWLLNKYQRWVDTASLYISSESILGIIIGGWIVASMVDGTIPKVDTTLIVFSIIALLIKIYYQNRFNKLSDGLSLAEDDFISFVRKFNIPYITFAILIMIVASIVPSKSNITIFDIVVDTSKFILEVSFWYVVSTTKNPPRKREDKQVFVYE